MAASTGPSNRTTAASLKLGRRAAYRIDKRSPEQRVGEHIEPQPNGCWLYNGDPDQYHTTFTGGGPGGTLPRYMPVHRFVYDTLVGHIPTGWELHHKCHTPGCVNPDHLEPLTKEEHAQRHANHGPEHEARPCAGRIHRPHADIWTPCKSQAKPGSEYCGTHAKVAGQP